MHQTSRCIHVLAIALLSYPAQAVSVLPVVIHGDLSAQIDLFTVITLVR